MNFRVATLTSALLGALGACRATGSSATGPAPSPGPTVSNAADSPAADRPTVSIAAGAPAWTAGSPVTLHKKRVHLVRKPEQPGTSPLLKECSFDAAYPEVDGVFEPAVAAKINAKLHIKLAVPEPRCETAESNELTYAISFNRAGILSVVFDNNWCCGAHPSFSREFVNLTIPDGEAITLAGLFAPNARPKLAELLRPLIAKLGGGEPFPGDDKELLDQLIKKPADFSIEDKGLRLSAFNSQPHVIQSMFAEGFLLSYPKLAGLLKVPGPLDPLLH